MDHGLHLMTMVTLVQIRSAPAIHEMMRALLLVSWKYGRSFQTDVCVIITIAVHLCEKGFQGNIPTCVVSHDGRKYG